MRLSRTLPAAVACLLGANLANAQEIHFNEIFASHTGTDYDEYIELIGTPGMSLDGWMVVILDGDSYAAGILDRAWDLTGLTVPTDGYFVLGNQSIIQADYGLANGPHGGGASDNIENGSQTYYLLWTDDVPFVEGLYNSDLDLDDDLVTTLAQFPGSITLYEIVGVYDGSDPLDQTFDGALDLGPDLAGPWSPAGYFRPEDYPAGWCTDEWLDFYLNGLTPGSQNPASTCTQSGGDVPVGSNYCGPANLNSTGQSGVMSGFGSTVATENNLELTASQLPTNQFGYFVTSETQGFVANPGGSQGNLCLSGNIGRFVAQVGSSGPTGTLVIQVDLANIPITPPQAVQAGETWNFQCWFRDVNPNNTSNFTDGLEILFN